jgi:hypothetical protein
MTTEQRAARHVALPRKRRRHAAGRGRIVVAALSAGSALVLVGAMARPSPSDPPPTTPSPPVVLQQPLGTRSSLDGTGRAPSVTRTDTPPVSRSHAS